MSWRSQVLVSLAALAIAVAVLLAIARYLPGTRTHLQAVTDRATHSHNIDKDAGQSR